MFRWLALLVTVLMLQACSAVKLGYQQLPTLSYWWLDSTLSLQDTQADRARQALGALHQWHRQNELPGHLELLQRVTELSQGSVQASQICGLWTEAQTQIDRTVRAALTQAAPVVRLLGPRQLSHLARSLDRKNEDWEQQWLQGSETERRERRLDKTLERYRSFYGDLNAAQIALLKTQVTQSLWQPEWGRKERLRREQDLLSTLRQLTQTQAPPDLIESALYGVWQRWFLPPDEGDRALAQKMTQQTCEHLARLHNSTTPEQRQRASRRLRAYERDLQDLLKP